MKRIALASMALAFLLPGAAQARPASKHEAIRYERAYAHVKHVFGARAAGRNIDKWGMPNGKPATAAKIRESTDVLHRYFAPPPPPPAPVTSTGTATPSAPATASSYSVPSTSYSSGGGCGGNTPYPGGGQCWAIPYRIVSCESKGQNVPNTQGSGANGYYQLMNGGTQSRAGQDAAAHALWANGAGASNWTCK